MIVKKMNHNPVIGILMLEHDLERPPGDPGNPATFSFPVIHKVVPGVTLERLLRKDETLLEPLTEAGRALVAQGAAAVTSGCGFFIYFQARVAGRLGVPVLLSSLLQIPLIQATLGPEQRIGVLTAHAGRLTRKHLLLAGMDPERPVKVAGLEGDPHFHRAVLMERGGLEFEKVQAEVVARARALAEGVDGPIGAILMECTNLPPFAAAVQRATGLPVYDVTTLIQHVHSALCRRPFQG